MIAAFKAFDPYAFLGVPRVGTPEQATPLAGLAGLAVGQGNARETVAPGSAATLAGLASLAARPRLSDNCEQPPRSDIGQGTTANPAKTANPADIERFVRAWHQGVASIDAERPPRDVPARRWRQLIYDAGRFLDSGFASQAAALGWDAYDLFGCDGERPFARIDNMGLIWLLDGNRLVALTEQSARIDMKNGVTQSYRRKPGDIGRVLAWQFEHEPARDR